MRMRMKMKTKIKQTTGTKTNQEKDSLEPLKKQLEERILPPGHPKYSQGWTIGSLGLSNMPKPHTCTEKRSKINYQFRPTSYWDKENRDALPPLHKNRSFTPHYLDKPFLPDLQRGEVEIAHISLDSTTCDRFSIRAKRTKKGMIKYSIADEYGDDYFIYDLAKKSSKIPLSLKELIFLLENSYSNDTQNLILQHNISQWDGESPKDDLRNFTYISSDIYKDLEKHCEQVFEEWVNRED